MCFQGTEILQSGWWHTDKHMDWGLLGGEGAGLRKLLLGTGGCEESKQMMVLVRAVLTLRKEHPGLVTSAPAYTTVQEMGVHRMCLKRSACE